MAKTVVAIFDRQDYAETAARQIKDQGLRTADISIVAKQSGDTGDGDSSLTGLKTGARVSSLRGGGDGGTNDNISDGVMTGGVLGGIAGLLIGAGTMAVPGLGIIAAAGPIAGLLSGAVTGSIVGGLVDLGIPEKESRQYETDIKAGKILFSMKTDEDKVDRVAQILRGNGAESVNTY